MVSLVALRLGAPAPAAAVTVTWKITGTFLGEQGEVSGVFNSTDTPNLTVFISFNITAVADSTSAIQATYGAGGGAGVPNVIITYVAGDGTGPETGSSNGGLAGANRRNRADRRGLGTLLHAARILRQQRSGLPTVRSARHCWR
jgi:hypothetical protein